METPVKGDKVPFKINNAFNSTMIFYLFWDLASINQVAERFNKMD